LDFIPDAPVLRDLRRGPEVRPSTGEGDSGPCRRIEREEVPMSK
jgi:hypothetical protein